MHDGIDRTIMDQAADRVLLAAVGTDELDITMLPSTSTAPDPMLEGVDDGDPAPGFQ